MDHNLLSFYASLSPGDHPHAVVVEVAASETQGAAAPEVKAPAAPHHAVPCSYGATTGCQLAFRSKLCCYAVQDHVCDPPNEILPSFVTGRGPVTMAQVYIANGCHR